MAVNDTAVRYDLMGAGSDVLVLIHELGGSIESWDLVAPSLAKGFRVVRYDMRGSGLSEKIAGAISIETLSRDLLAILDRLHMVEPVRVAGCAVGGAIALHFAATYPERVACVVAMSPAVGVSTEARPARLAAADRIERTGMRTMVAGGLKDPYPEAVRHDPARYESYLARCLGNDPKSFAAILRMIAGLDMTADLAKIRCPALVLAGRHDGTRPPDMVRTVANAIPGARFEELETAHFMPVQTPELIAATLEKFFRSVPGRLNL